MHHSTTRASILAALLALAGAGAALAQSPRSVEIRAEQVSENVYVLYGQGGNIGLSIGDDGAFMIDDQFAPLTGKILEAVGELTDEPVRFLVNTHWHFDHTGGNENLGKEGAIIVANENVRQRMSTEQFLEAFNHTVPASPEGALPVVTFRGFMTIHWNSDEIQMQHVANAHTDGDTVIWFKNANVLHMGDTFFNGMYPFIDVATGGSVSGVIEAATTVLDSEEWGPDVRIIPGHGEVCGIEKLRAYRDMLVAVRNHVVRLVREGKTRDEAIAAKPTKDYDAEWGGGFLDPETFTGIVYDSVKAGMN